MIEIILPGNTRLRRDSTEAPAAHVIRGLVHDYKLKGEFRLRSAEGVLRGNKKMSSLPDGTVLKLEPR